MFYAGTRGTCVQDGQRRMPGILACNKIADRIGGLLFFGAHSKSLEDLPGRPTKFKVIVDLEDVRN